MRGPNLGRRLLYLSYEGLLLFGVSFFAGIVSFGTSFIVARWAGREFVPPQGAVLGLWVFFALGLYFAWFWTHGGQTLAMKTWRLRLTDSTGQPLHWGRALLRYVVSWWFLIPLLALVKSLDLGVRVELAALSLGLLGPSLLTLFDPDRQTLQDRLAGTRLMDERVARGSPTAAPESANGAPARH